MRIKVYNKQYRFWPSNKTRTKQISRYAGQTYPDISFNDFNFKLDTILSKIKLEL